MNTSKTHLDVEQFSMKTNWRLAERLDQLATESTIKPLRNAHTESGGREDKPSISICVPGSRIRGKGRLHRWK